MKKHELAAPEQADHIEHTGQHRVHQTYRFLSNWQTSVCLVLTGVDTHVQLIHVDHDVDGLFQGAVDDRVGLAELEAVVESGEKGPVSGAVQDELEDELATVGGDE
jgi:hypothetical protein